MDLDAVYWALCYLYYSDKANACMHCAPVKFSPVTFRLSAVLREYGYKPAEVLEIENHRGKYEEDKGR